MKLNIIDKLSKTNVVQEYENDTTTTELAKKYNVSSETIRKYLLYCGVKLRGARRRKSLREKPVIGTKYGQWTIISQDVKTGSEIKNSQKRSLFWLCKCNCGHIEWKKVSSLKNKQTKACRKCCKTTYDGRSNIDKLLVYKFESTRKNIASRKNRGRRKPLTFNITINDIVNLYNSQNKKCALSGLDISRKNGKSLQDQYLSIDRIDSYEGYESDNIQLVDKRINMMKGSLSNEEFIHLCKCVANHNS